MKKLFISGLLVLLVITCSFSMGMAYLNFSREMGYTPLINLSVNVKLAIPQHNPGLFQNSLLIGLAQTRQ
jgi:hypothetical protein